VIEPRPSWDCHVHVFDGQAAARGGHYRPAHHPLSAIEAEAARVGIGHLVLVQPSVYGTDNGLLIQALQRSAGRHRGVVVLEDSVRPGELDTMHAAGVRAARLNRVSPVGEPLGVADRFRRLAPHLLERGWHLEWYARPEHLAEIAALHAETPLVCVLDHLAGMHAHIATDDPAWKALESLAQRGAWVKLSGWYRLQAAAPYHALLPLIRRVAALFGDRLLWGSDWPHTSFAAAQMPRYRSLWTPVVAALGIDAARRLRQSIPSLYR